MSIQRGRPRIPDGDPNDPNKGNTEILRQRQRARMRREKEREQRAKSAKMIVELEQTKSYLETARWKLRAMTEEKERVEFERACDKVIIHDLQKNLEMLRNEISDLKFRHNEPDGMYYEQKIFEQKVFTQM
ncbi:hypothetical protein L596_030552 [Steinernema carpocapsae]|uniref:Uncharacterized protein n=1 Tax=Steinernema carpocapsae TaxID=34508 RepID=A0A4U5LPS5_STECR|nr:hypothetical protein L596_030552 [Steinernema carpocapsae]